MEDIDKLAREMANDVADFCSGDETPDIWVCVPMTKDRVLGKHARVGKCHMCKGAITYDILMKNRLKKKHKKICAICALKEYGDQMHPIQEMLVKGGFH